MIGLGKSVRFIVVGIWKWDLGGASYWQDLDVDLIPDCDKWTVLMVAEGNKCDTLLFFAL
jgi:hypothetical protein